MGNPKMWDMENLPVGEVRDYTIFNENGNARREYSAFIGCREGDVLIGYTGSPKKHICAIFECVTGVNKKRIYFKKIISLENVICREDIINDNILVEMAAMKSPQGSLFPVTKEQFKRFIELARERNSDIDFTDFDAQEAQGDDMQNSKYTRDDFLREVYISSEKYDSLVRLLKRKKNVILQGAPGVGKTYIAKRLAYSMMAERDESCIEMVQFHQSYSYDDFVRGYKPNETSFEIKDGIFYLFCKKALENPTKDYFFIIDEINRGNLSKIFGELLMLIECDHRGESLKLSVGGEDFKVPENVYIIGMMNTADRSLALIDYALRRRFGFVEIEPGFKSVGFKKVCEKFGNQKLDALIQLVEKLNSKIEKDSSLGKGFCIGHSYFCFNDTPCTDESLSCIVNHDILPMLNEYWFDDRDSYEEWEKEFAKWEENLKVESE
jgi:5-methylcytosine-specific restriction protein B